MWQYLAGSLTRAGTGGMGSRAVNWDISFPSSCPSHLSKRALHQESLGYFTRWLTSEEKKGTEKPQKSQRLYRFTPTAFHWLT